MLHEDALKPRSLGGKSRKMYANVKEIKIAFFTRMCATILLNLAIICQFCGFSRWTVFALACGHLTPLGAQAGARATNGFAQVQ
jgi:hypothetical protein